jgi:predicted ATPase
MRTLEKLSIRNFKSIREQTLDLGALNVFIGGNGSGKSNLVEVFRFLREIVDQNLGGYTAMKGGADALLHFGRKVSPSMTIGLVFGETETSNSYEVTLTGTPADELIVSREASHYHERLKYQQPHHNRISYGSKESKLRTDDDISARQVTRDLESYRIYHFHDTSGSAPMRGANDVDDNRFLRPQAENLAAFLYWLQEKQPAHMANIQGTIRQIAPFFDRFRLAPLKLNPSKIRLEWQEKGTDTYFNASALSDGTLRFICLATLLLQPALPPLLLLDEPELGLHPAAITLLAALLDSASTRTQVMIATQSVTLVNQFEPVKVWTVDREGHESVFRHLSEEKMTGWLDDYSLGDLWEKNVIGARP